MPNRPTADTIALIRKARSVGAFTGAADADALLREIDALVAERDRLVRAIEAHKRRDASVESDAALYAALEAPHG